jgi:two-component system chemotaxis response regulator CheY
MDLGFKNIHDVSDGHQAMEYVAQAYKSPNPVGLILCDHEMPEVDGFQFYRVLHESPECREIPFIMVTGHSEPELVAAMAARGIKNYILKPISPQQLGEKMMKMLVRGS